MDNDAELLSTKPAAIMGLRWRWLIELIVVFVLAFGIGGTYLWSGHRQELLASQWASRLTAARVESALALDQLVTGQAEAVFRAYSAGIHAAVLAGRKESLDLSIEELIRLPGVVFVNILQPDGVVVTSSDRKLIVLGKVGERGTWALGVKEFSKRPGDLAGTVEMARPIQDAAGVKAVLWLAYDTEHIKAQAQTHGPGDPASGA